MTQRKPSRLEFTALKVWHAALAGSYLVAWVTADEDTYAMHLFAGYAVLAAIVLRLVAGMLAPEASPLRLPRPSIAATRAWLACRKGRTPLFAWIAAALLVSVGLAAVSGALADGRTWMEDPHEAIADASLWVIFGHIVFVTIVFGGRRLATRLRTLASALWPIRLIREKS